MTRQILVIATALVVGAVHFVTGPAYSGPWRPFVNGNLVDVTLPFVMFLVMGNIRRRALGHPVFRAVVLFAIGAGVETLQYLGIPVFGRTYDPLDLVAYAVGIAGGMLFETTVVSRLPDASNG